MDLEIVEKAKIIGKKLNELATLDSCEKCAFFTKQTEFVISDKFEEGIDLTKLPKIKLEQFITFRNQHHHQIDFSTIHTHIDDSTFSIADIETLSIFWKNYGICYQFVVTPIHLFALHISLDLKKELRFSDLLFRQLIKTSDNIWENIGMNKFKKITSNKGLIEIKAIPTSEQKKEFNKIWKLEFAKFFKRWNYINKNQLEYAVYEIHNF